MFLVGDPRNEQQGSFLNAVTHELKKLRSLYPAVIWKRWRAEPGRSQAHVEFIAS